MKKYDLKTRTAWFQAARFGMFIHWGLYSIPGGKWKGIEVPWVSEWIMRKLKIPVREYEKLCTRFLPRRFNAREWVDAAVNSGMKYMVVTAKHHDGFAMFHSKYDTFNVVDATPFKRDPLLELAEECRRANMKLGFYYSQDQDWHESGATGNDWDFKDKSDDKFDNYINSKVKTQLRELLTNYGKIAIIWFDTPLRIKPEQSSELKNLVHDLQPECLVSGRIGNEQGDYSSLGDNQLPARKLDGVWEGLGTTNESWGYKKNDNAWKSAEQILETLCELSSKNANYLLNIGPRGDGSIPQKATNALKKAGDWLKINGDAIYASTPNPIMMHYKPRWGYITQKYNSLNLIIFNMMQNEIIIYGIRNAVERVYILHDKKKILNYAQKHQSKYDYHKLSIELPVKEKLHCPFVIKIEFAEELDINNNSYRADTF
jgi:alpha-L-fucosidase